MRDANQRDALVIGRQALGGVIGRKNASAPNSTMVSVGSKIAREYMAWL